MNTQDPACAVASATTSLVLTPVQEALTSVSSGQWDHLSSPKQGLGESRKGVHKPNQGLEDHGGYLWLLGVLRAGCMASPCTNFSWVLWEAVPVQEEVWGQRQMWRVSVLVFRNTKS